jgi:hypothetical protein
MKKQLFFPLYALFLGLTAVACHKHDDENDKTPPTIVITAPALNTSITGTVAIAGIVADEASLHKLSIKVTRDSDGVEVFSASPVVHDLTSYTIAEVWTPTGITSETSFTLKVVAEDHGENKYQKDVSFKVKL